MTKLVVVESPAKARTIGKYLGPDFTVKASVGHVKDLPKKSLGVNVEEGFEPQYEVIRGKGKVLKEIRKASKEAEIVFLAPDPDREGEAIAWHIAQEIQSINSNIRRVLFNEITKKGISRGLAAPRDLDKNKFESQQARRILDRLVGYQISPLLWKKVKRGLSAGRVQSVAVRLVLEREREIRAFDPEEYWVISARLTTADGAEFVAKLARIGTKKAEIHTEELASKIVAEIKAADLLVSRVAKTERLRRPPPPFITSKLQQEAVRKLRMTAKRTMALAQRLYEGVDLGGGRGRVGLITYMRTDSVRVSEDALAAARDYVAHRFGPDYLPDQPIRYRSKKSAQDAHEAIRPTEVDIDPDTLAKLLATAGNTGSGMDARERRDLHRLYSLIWKRFVASQMKPAIQDVTTVDVSAGRLILRAQGLVTRFPGYTSLYEEARDDNGQNGSGQTGSKEALLPPIEEGDPLGLKKVDPEQKFTQPPARFTEATLVKELEEQGIGRPSTYAAILSTIQDRGYVLKDQGRFHITPLGELVTDLLVESFPDILNVEFTAKMETQLDKIEEGTTDWHEILALFYESFKKDLDQAVEHMRNVKRETIPTDLVCDKCGAPMVIRWGRNGEFLACSSWPECKNTKEFRRKPDGGIEIVEPETVEDTCPLCGAPMVVKNGRYGKFLACSRYPDCKGTKPITLGIGCPREGCDGEIVQKRSRRGKTFYGCSNYAKTGCDFVVWDLPVAHTCPECGFPIMVKKSGRRGNALVCPECKTRISSKTDSEPQS